MALGNQYPANFLSPTGTMLESQGQVLFTDSTNQPIVGTASTGVSPVGVITSGALPTATLSSGTGAQVSTTRDVSAYIALTADATNNAATAAVALSPDNVTYSTLYTLSLAAAVNNTGAIVLPAHVRVPAGWYIKVTVSHMTITSTTYA
jgi:hypothetical protein